MNLIKKTLTHIGIAPSNIKLLWNSRTLVKNFHSSLIYPNILEEHIYKLVLAEPNKFFFVQVGANDGVKNDPLFELVKSLKLDGLLIEPIESAFERLKENYSNVDASLVFENCAISDDEKDISIYTLSQQFIKSMNNDNIFSDRVSSLIKEHLISYLKRAAKKKNIDLDIESVETAIVEEKVRTYNLKTLIDKYKIPQISLLQIDTEGYDFEIIKQIKHIIPLPKIVNYEHKHLSPETQIESWQFLAEKNYALHIHGIDAGDTIAIHRSML